MKNKVLKLFLMFTTLTIMGIGLTKAAENPDAWITGNIIADAIEDPEDPENSEGGWIDIDDDGDGDIRDEFGLYDNEIIIAYGAHTQISNGIDGLGRTFGSDYWGNSSEYEDAFMQESFIVERNDRGKKEYIPVGRRVSIVKDNNGLHLSNTSPWFSLQSIAQDGYTMPDYVDGAPMIGYGAYSIISTGGGDQQHIDQDSIMDDCNKRKELFCLTSTNEDAYLSQSLIYKTSDNLEHPYLAAGRRTPIYQNENDELSVRFSKQFDWYELELNDYNGYPADYKEAVDNRSKTDYLAYALIPSWVPGQTGNIVPRKTSLHQKLVYQDLSTGVWKVAKRITPIKSGEYTLEGGEQRIGLHVGYHNSYVWNIYHVTTNYSGKEFTFDMDDYEEGNEIYGYGGFTLTDPDTGEIEIIEKIFYEDSSGNLRGAWRSLTTSDVGYDY